MGPYHFAFVYTVTMLSGLDNTLALTMAIIMHLVSILPPIIIGPIILIFGNISVKDISGTENKAEI